MEKQTHLNDRQARFVDEYLICNSAAEAARRAGYSKATARQIGSRLLSDVVVSEAIRAKQSEYAAELQITKDDVIAGVLAAINMARQQENPAAMIQGCSALARLLGFFTPETARVEVSLDTAAMRASMASLSDSDLLALMARGGN